MQLRPSHLRKSSRGLDLAIAAAILWETKQLAEFPKLTPLIYGELTLKGSVLMPEDINDLFEVPGHSELWTGTNEVLRVAHKQFADLAHLNRPSQMILQNTSDFVVRPKLPQIMFISHRARLAELVAAGEHASLFAGPQGVGKTTLLHLLPSLVAPPANINGGTRVGNIAWRPVIFAHHLTPPLSLVGVEYRRNPERSLVPTAVFWSWMNFWNSVAKFKRLCVDPWRVAYCVSPAAVKCEFPARFQLLAATNLCPCGRLVPESIDSCRCKFARRKHYLARLSGPVLDRFELLQFLQAEDPNQLLVSSENILQRVNLACEFRLKERGQQLPNSRMELEALESQLCHKSKGSLFQSQNGCRSLRRWMAWLRLSRTVADFDESINIKLSHLQESWELAIGNIQRLEHLQAQ